MAGKMNDGKCGKGMDRNENYDDDHRGIAVMIIDG